jgi:phage terminase large subunit-like protein
MTQPVDVTARALELLEKQREFQRFNAIDSYFPADGPFRRELYAPHMAFFRAGAKHRERLFLAGNRVGKTNAGAYEMALHLTGSYPEFWEGKRFTRPVSAWASGDSSKTTRDILERALLGPAHDRGSGMIPRDVIVRTTNKPGIADTTETIFVRHISGGISELTFKSYAEGRDSYQNTAKDVCWLDEEPDQSIYVEQLLRTMTTQGIVYITATPLLGLTEVIRSFIQPADDSEKFFVQCEWSQVPHLDETAKRQLLSSIPEYQREARSKGVPQLGSGAVYQISESDIVVPDFPIPDHYPRAFGLDVGWKKTAAIWGARDNESGVIYLFSEHYQGHQQPSLHAEAIKARGPWVPGVVDPAAQGRTQTDGEQMIELYRRCGLNLSPAINAVEAGLYETWQLMSAGKLKVFRSLGNWLQEFRLYQRDNEGRVVKQNDHLMDATRYLIMSGRQRMTTAPKKVTEPQYLEGIPSADRWMM